jgi:hypothetical protein
MLGSLMGAKPVANMTMTAKRKSPNHGMIMS